MTLRSRKTLGDYISEALPTLLIWGLGGIATGYAGYATGLSRISTLETKEKSDREAIACLIRHIDELEADVVRPNPCQLQTPE